MCWLWGWGKRSERTALEVLGRVECGMYGLELVKLSQNKLKRGTVYVLLQRLESEGLVTSKYENFTDPEINIQRRMYSITEAGRARLKELT